ncbi:MAG: FAD-dependent oxidoreductase [Firmicutes bacterium]|nr:FAD-dependent oxidoreductase [Bacillota bacterium]
MVVVVGGGASGLGVAWDLTLRGIPVTVVEAGEIGAGTSGRFHGLLHSGARYVVADPVSARQCYQENQILRRVAGAAIEDTGGYFIAVGEEDDYEARWLSAMRDAGIPAVPVEASALNARISGLNPAQRGGYWVPDAVLEGFRLLYLLSDNVAARGGKILTHSRLMRVHQRNGRVVGATLHTPQGMVDLACDAVVNAAGPWAGGVARLFSDTLSMHLAAGVMLLFAYRRVPVVVNRLAYPGDGDIFVPHGKTVIFGTTDVRQDAPEPPVPSRAEVEALLRKGQDLFPDIAAWRALRAFSGVRPLYANESATSSRHVSRDFSIINHGARVGLDGAFSLVGGKWTTFRLMAERLGDEVARYLKVSAPCRTAEMPLADPRPRGSAGLSPVVCECEGVTVQELSAWKEVGPDEWRARTWWAMGPCQGTMCLHRGLSLQPAAGAEGWRRRVEAVRAERARGFWPAAYGDNAREFQLQQAVRFQTLGEEDADGNP